MSNNLPQSLSLVPAGVRRLKSEAIASWSASLDLAVMKDASGRQWLAVPVDQVEQLERLAAQEPILRHCPTLAELHCVYVPLSPDEQARREGKARATFLGRFLCRIEAELHLEPAHLQGLRSELQLLIS